MEDIFKNKFFIILLIIICVLTLSTIILNLSGRGSIVTDAVNIILTPFQNFAVIIKNSFSGFTAYFTEFNHMKEQIAELTAQLEEASAQNQNARKQQEQIDMFMSFYELKKRHMDYDLYPAKVTSREPGNYLTSLTINKGSLDTVEKDMPVIAAKGAEHIIVGYVGEVGVMTSKVVPFIRTGTAIGAYIQRTEETCIVEGDFTLEKDGLCRVAFLAEDSAIEVGDRIYSSGDGGIYPEDLYIGEVVHLEPDRNSHTIVGYVKPAADFNSIKDVMVILKFERSFY